MSYSTPEQVRLVISSTAGDRGGTAADLSDAQLQHEIDAAEAIIDSRLQNRYQVPFDSAGDNSVPKLISVIATDLAAYRADLNYRKSKEYDNDNMPILLRQKDAERLLEGIRRGRNTINWPRTSDDDFGAVVVNPGEGPLIYHYNVFLPYPGW